MATEIGSQADRAKIAAIRDELPAVRKYIYLNTGTNGPLPRRSHEAMEACAMDELLEGRIGPEAFARTQAIFAGTRAAVAALLGCDPDEIALTHNTTEGLNIALMGLDWQRGDEIVTAATEHPGGLYPIYLLRQRYGVKIRMTDIGLKDLNPVAALQNVLSPKTKAVVLSHVSWTSPIALVRFSSATLHRPAAWCRPTSMSWALMPMPVQARSGSAAPMVQALSLCARTVLVRFSRPI
jgi:L-cysteine/cystine lyase